MFTLSEATGVREVNTASAQDIRVHAMQFYCRERQLIVHSRSIRTGYCMLSGVSPQGQCCFMAIEGRVNAVVFRDFLKRLTTGAQRKVFLVVDGHPAHKAKPVGTFVLDNADPARVVPPPAILA